MGKFMKYRFQFFHKISSYITTRHNVIFNTNLGFIPTNIEKYFFTLKILENEIQKSTHVDIYDNRKKKTLAHPYYRHNLF